MRKVKEMQRAITLRDTLMFRLCILLAAGASFASTWYFYSQDLITAYGDARTRLMISRQVWDSPSPGLKQLGGNWPPLPQIGMLTTVWNDYLYSTGLSGAFVSMVSYILAIAFLYKLVHHVTESKMASLCGVVAFSTPNLLFMQAVPMSEVPFITTLVMSVYYLVVWTSDTEQLQPLVFAALSTVAAIYIRYEGWVLAGLLATVVMYTTWRSQRSFHQTKAYLLWFGFLPIVAVIAWLAYNLAYFSNPLYFIVGDYAPWRIAEAATVKTSGDLWLSTQVYGRTALDNAGIAGTILCIVGYLSLRVHKVPVGQALALCVLLFPIPFFTFSIYQGSSVVIWHPDYHDGANWGTRYGTLWLPAVGMGVGLITAWFEKWWIQSAILALLIASSIIGWQAGILDVGEAIDNRDNPDALVQSAAREALEDNYDRGLVLMQRFGNEGIMFGLNGVPLSKLVIEGTDLEFRTQAINDPVGAHIDWIVMRKRFGAPDELWERLYDSEIIRQFYVPVYEENDVVIYRIKPQSDIE